MSVTGSGPVNTVLVFVPGSGSVLLMLGTGSGLVFSHIGTRLVTC